MDNDIIITVHSSIENTNQTNTNNSLNQSNPNSNSSAIQWKKYVNETIGISLEYPSNWEKIGDHKFEPRYEDYPLGERPYGTHFDLFYGKPPFDNLEVLLKYWLQMFLIVLMILETMR